MADNIYANPGGSNKHSTSFAKQSNPRYGKKPIFGLLRWSVAFVVAATVTMALFFAMRSLIQLDGVSVEEQTEPIDTTINFTVDPVEPEPRTTITNIERPEAPHPTRRIVRNVDGQESTIEFGGTPQTGAVEIDTDIRGQVSIPPVQTVKVPPVYPVREKRLGIQGSCRVRYDVLASGATANIQVRQCDSSGFERATVEAVARWRFAPVTDQRSDTVIQRGLRTTLQFNLDLGDVTT